MSNLSYDDLNAQLEKTTDAEEITRIMQLMKPLREDYYAKLKESANREPTLGPELTAMHAKADEITAAGEVLRPVLKVKHAKLNELEAEMKKQYVLIFDYHNQFRNLLFTGKGLIMETANQIPETPDDSKLTTKAEELEAWRKFGEEMEATEAGFKKAVSSLDAIKNSPEWISLEEKMKAAKKIKNECHAEALKVHAEITAAYGNFGGVLN